MSSAITTQGSLFPEKLVSELFTKVAGHSALAKLSKQIPIPFAGNEIMTFSLDGEAELVGEGVSKSTGNAEIGSVSIVPVKFVYQHRLSDEFVNAADEAQIGYLQAFGEGFAGAMARALDIAAIQGVNPKTGTTASAISAKSFDTLVTETVTYDSTAPDDNIEDAVSTIQAANGQVTGIVMAPAFASALAAMKSNNLSIYPEFKFGANPGSWYGMNVDVNTTISANSSTDMAIVGDFARAFRWGYSKNIPLEVIQYGDPDGQGDLKRQNQIVLRAEAYIGWGILDADSFVRVVSA